MILDRYVKAAEFEMPELAAEADLVRALEPWRGRRNTKATLEELEERSKPSEARLTHLEELVQLLTEWKDQLDIVLSRKDWDGGHRNRGKCPFRQGAEPLSRA